MVYSYDGINWTTISQNILTTVINDVEWNGTVFVAVGEGTTYSIAYSYDGINWSETTSLLGLTTAYCVTWGQNYFVVGGQGSNNIAYSSDGISWTALNLSNVTSIRDIKCGASSWVLGGSSSDSKPISFWATNPTLTTGNGSWTAGTGLPNLTGCVNSVSFGIVYDSSLNSSDSIPSTLFCLGGFTDNTTICAYSTDGKIWISVDASFDTTPINSITWYGNRFTAVGGENGKPSKISYSYDGITWYSYVGFGTSNPSQLFTTAIYGIASNPSQTLGSAYIESAFTLSDPSNLNVNNKLDISSTILSENLTITIKSNPVS